jgi:predicted RNA-binding Zn-ribbon protein involved in translation (DUF1610 family)
MAKSIDLMHADQATDPKTRRWWLAAAAQATFGCPQCGQLVTCYKSRQDPFVYDCGNCGYGIDERLHFSQRRLRRWR